MQLPAESHDKMGSDADVVTVADPQNMSYAGASLTAATDDSLTVLFGTEHVG